MYLSRVTVSGAAVSPLETVTGPAGQFLFKPGAGISATVDLVKSLDVVVFPPAGYDAMGIGTGAVQEFDGTHKPTLNPSIDFGPVKSPWLIGATLAQCERMVLTMGFITAPWLYAIPLDRNGKAAVLQMTIENGGKVVYDSITHTIIAPNQTDLRPFTLGGTAVAPTLMLKTTGWSAPRDINVSFAVVKAPLFPTCK
jgi:hypothetical protein